MRNSILFKLLAVLSLILVISTGVSLYFADINVRQIIEEKQVQLFKEKIGTLIKMLQARAKKLELTMHPEAYREDFQQAALDMIRASYYTTDNLPLQSYPIVINNDKKIILQPALDNNEVIRKLESLFPVSQHFAGGGEQEIIVNNEMMGVFLPFEPWGWQIGYLVPVKVMYNAANQMLSILFWSLFIGTFTALGFIFFAVYRIVKPLSDLRKAADALASGDYTCCFNQEFNFNKKDEIGSLARSLDKMRIVIQERIAELKRINIHLREEIQARKEADAARLSQELDYQEIFNATSEAIVIFDADDWVVLRVNNTMLDLFGYAAQQVIGQKVGLILQEQGGNAVGQFSQNIQKAVSGEHVVFEWRVKKQRGGFLWTEISLRSSIIGGNRCVLAVFRDVSERKLAELEKTKMEDQFRHIQKMEAVGTLAGGIAHDFNNILTPLLGFSEMLVTQLEKGSEQQQEAKAIYTAGLRARDLVKQILAISRKGDMTLKPVLVQAEIAEAYSLVEASLPKDITITCSIDESCEPVLADPGQIHQIILNLCTNAYQAMKETGGELSISLKKLTIADPLSVDDFHLKQGGYVNIEVTDSGCGIPDDVKKKIFDPYYTTKVTGEGTGLGLSIVQGIIKSLNGHITVESEQGKTVFAVYLPTIGKSDGFPVLIGADEIQKGEGSIMFVDDEKSVLDVGRAILEKLGYKVCIYADSNRALASLQATPDSFDLVISDMTMPGMSGFELSSEIKKTKPDMPIILLTGYSDIINREQAQQFGIYAILTKPINVSIISQTVRNALESQL